MTAAPFDGGRTMTDYSDETCGLGQPAEARDAAAAGGLDMVAQETTRRSLLKNAVGLSVLASGAGVMEPISAQAFQRAAPPAKTSFTLAVLPDTQFYSRYATTDEHQQFQTTYGSTPYEAQTQFIVDNAAKYNIPFVIHLGDVVDQVGKVHQWEIADAAMKRLESAKIPYSILAGNHDVLQAFDYENGGSQGWGTDRQRNNGIEPYLRWFPAGRAAQQATFKGRDGSGWHEYHVFEAFGVKFMVLSLSWRASDDAIAWANGVIKANPTLPVILVNHQLLNIDKDGVSPLEVPYGQMIWDRLIAGNDQIFMTLNGHYHGAAHIRRTNNFGNPVDIMVVDYQMAYQGGNALMRLYEFDFSANKIDVASFSPWVVAKPVAKLNHFDRAWLTESNHQFTLPINFARRFAGFTKIQPVMATSGTQILPRLKRDLFANYKERVQPVLVAARDSADYPVVPGTLAHWRVPDNMVAGAVVPAGTILPDLTGRNNMTRGPLSGWGYSGQPGDVVWSSDRHRLSAAAGSVRFLNTDKRIGRSSYFLTAADAPLNAETLSGGYTIEAFIKFDAAWTVAAHRWCNALARLANRGRLPQFWGGDQEASPILFSISNLREVQWEIVPASNTHGAQANWSGEIMADTWYHVAIVNDPAARTTTMYVEGTPVLRNTAGEVGIGSPAPDCPWAIGCGWWNGAIKDGWFGCLGEIRIVGRPIASDFWLTARRTA